MNHSNPEQLGKLLTEAQAFFDRYAAPACPEELTSPVLHRVLSYKAFEPHIWGGKGVGSQGDGTAQFICRSEADQKAVIQILERDLGMLGLEFISCDFSNNLPNHNSIRYVATCNCVRPKMDDRVI
jgi:hypothetical protein